MTGTAWLVHVEMVPNDSMAEPSDYGPFRSRVAADRFADAVKRRLAQQATTARVTDEWGEESFLSVAVVAVQRPTVGNVLADWRVAQ